MPVSPQPSYAAILTWAATPACAATPRPPNLHSKPITTQMNDLPLDLSQSVSQVHIPMHPYLSPSHSL